LSGWVVFRLSSVAALACAALVLLPSASGRSRNEPCGIYPFADSSTHWEVVFGHRTSLAEAIVFRRELAAKAFKGIEFEKNYCDDIEIEIPGLDSPAARQAFWDEAYASRVPISFEPPDSQKQNVRGEVTAVFGHRPTLKRASALLGDVAGKGWRVADIVRVSINDWKVVVRKIPAGSQADFAAEARGGGYSVTFER